MDSARKTTTIKIPQLPKKEMQAFMTSTFEKVGLKGPPVGVQQMEWSFDSQYLATKCEEMPQTVWIWDLTTLDLTSVLIHLDHVRCFKFAPQSHALYIATGQKRLFSWGQQGACVIELPQNELISQAQPTCLSVIRLKWNPSGSNLVLIDAKHALLAFPQSDLLP